MLHEGMTMTTIKAKASEVVTGRFAGLVAAVIGLLTVTEPAWSADLAPPPAAPVPYSWSGLYIGLNAGYANAKVTETASGGGGSGSANVPGGLGGFQIGANYQTGAIVLGFEADFAGYMGTKSVTVAGGAVSGRICVRPVLALRNRGRRGYRAHFHRECRRHRLCQHDQYPRRLDGRRRPRGCSHRQSQCPRRIPLRRHRQYQCGASRPAVR